MTAREKGIGRTISIVLLAALMLAGFSSCGKMPNDPQFDYKVIENTDSDKAVYPYIVKTESAAWYLAGDDIDLLGEDPFYEGLYDILKYQESDFAEAREALGGFIPEKIEPVKIYTDFCGKAGISEFAGAYYNERSNFIKVFSGWEMAKNALLHEYIHYLTVCCTDAPVLDRFFAEGIAEYISKIVCQNRMLRSINMGFSEEETSFYREHGAWDEKEECVDPKRYYFGTAETIAQGRIVGMEYPTIFNTVIVRTPQIQQAPGTEDLSFAEAACIMAYLVDSYSRETVYSHMNNTADDLESIFGESFSEIYHHWTEWNTEQCKKMGLIM